MKGIQLDSYIKESTKELKVSTVPDLKPKEDDYLIQVHAVAINFYDTLQVRGKYQYQPPFPFIAGFEFSGKVVSKGPTASSTYSVGDNVFGSSQGAFATHVIAKENQLQPNPKGWSFTDAAGLFATAATSYAGLSIRASVKPGDWCLIHGAAGGVGLNAVQIAKALGGRVIAIATGAEHKGVCESFGAEHVVDYIKTPNWEQEVQKLTGGHGVDVVFDTVGLLERSMKCAAWDATLVAVGFAGGKIEKLSANRVLLKNIKVAGLHWGAYAVNEASRVPQVWKGIYDLIAQNKFRPVVWKPEASKAPKLVGLESIPTAMQLLEKQAAWGKMVIPIVSEPGAKL